MPTPTPADYGFSDAFFNSDKELKALLAKAKKGKWTATQFQAGFMKTKWYRSRQASVREWKDLTTRDPAETKAKIAAKKAELSDKLTQLGISMSWTQLDKLAVQSLQYSLSDSQLNNMFAELVSFSDGTGGQVAAYETQIKDLAWQYGVDVTSAQMQDWVRGLVGQKYNEESIADFVRDAAKSKYAGLVAQLDTGRSTRDIAGQHIASMSRLLEMEADTISLDDPLLAPAIQGTVDPKTGLPVAKTVFQMEQDVRKDKRWLGTKNARDSMASVMFQIGQDWGMVA